MAIVLDLLLAGLIVYGLVSGFRNGGWHELTSSAVLILAIAIPVAFAAPLAHLLEGRLSARYNLLFFFSVAGLWIVAEMVGTFIVSAVRSAWIRSQEGTTPKIAVDAKRRIRHTRHDTMTSVNRYLGALAGAVEMSALAWITLSLFVVVERDLGLHVSQSLIFRAVDQRNAITMLFAPQADDLERALQRVATAKKSIHGHNPFDKLMSDPRVRAMVQDSSTQDGSVLSSSHVLSALTDPSLARQMRAAIDEANAAERAQASAIEAATQE